VAEAIAAVKRYFEGEETDFSGVKVDLSGQDPFFERIYEAARRVGWGHTTTSGALAKELGAGPEAARDVGQAMATNPVALIIPCHGSWRRVARSAVFLRREARQLKNACSRWRAFASILRHRLSNLSSFDTGKRRRFTSMAAPIITDLRPGSGERAAAERRRGDRSPA
jgi:methylated-DNA-[protein]-cysteine S-methyltransferase